VRPMRRLSDSSDNIALADNTVEQHARVKLASSPRRFFGKQDPEQRSALVDTRLRRIFCSSWFGLVR